MAKQAGESGELGTGQRRRRGMAAAEKRNGTGKI